MYHDTLSTHDCNCQSHNISLQTVLDSAFSSKKGKCVDDESISAEHIFEAPLVLFDRFHQLFNCMLRHSYVPSQFQLGTVIPLVKDRHGDKGEMNNYCGITIAQGSQADHGFYNSAMSRGNSDTTLKTKSKKKCDKIF